MYKLSCQWNCGMSSRFVPRGAVWFQLMIHRQRRFRCLYCYDDPQMKFVRQNETQLLCKKSNRVTAAHATKEERTTYYTV